MFTPINADFVGIFSSFLHLSLISILNSVKITVDNNEVESKRIDCTIKSPKTHLDNIGLREPRIYSPIIYVIYAGVGQ